VLSDLRERLTGLELAPGLAAESLCLLPETLSNLLRRWREGAGGPLRLAFFGPTGAGKSKLFNSLLGANLSPAGFRRPCTMRPVYSLDAKYRELVVPIDGEVHVRSGGLWADVVFIDTPDFDSVERQNRAEAERVFRAVELILFVTDVQKYADQSTWEYLERIFSQRKPVILVINRVTGEGAVSDFRARLGNRPEAGELIVVRAHPLEDATPLPEEEPALAAMRERIAKIVGTPPERRATLVAAFRADLETLFELWDGLVARLQGYLEGLTQLGQRLEDRYKDSVAQLGRDIDVPVGAGLKAEVYARVFERIQKIDILRYPRKLLALPFKGVKQLAGKWWPFRQDRVEKQVDEPTSKEAFQSLERKLLSLTEETSEDFRTEARTPGLLGREDASALRISHDEIVGMYRERDQAFREWLKREAEETASQLTTENKAKFILSQVIYNSVMVGVQIHTAGQFTLVELATDGVLSPLVAKGVGMAVSSEKVREFEQLASAEHQRLLAEVLDEARGRYRRHLEGCGAWREAFESLADDMKRLRDGKETLIDAFKNDAFKNDAFKSGRDAHPADGAPPKGGPP